MSEPLVLTYADSPLGRGTFEQDLLDALKEAIVITVRKADQSLMFFYPRHGGGNPELSIYIKETK